MNCLVVEAVPRPAIEAFLPVGVYPQSGTIAPSLTLHRHAAAVPQRTTEVTTMLGWAVTFLIVALIAGLLGFGVVAGVAIEAAKIVFFVAIVLFAISVIAGLIRGRTPTVP
jgi:uncharacterized membrane protein YtjA (UPF0391 family)